MGTQFANVVTLVVAGEIFAKGLTTIGTVDAVIRGAEHSGLGGIGVMIIMALVIAICAIVMALAMRRLCHLPVLFRISQPDYMYQRL